MNNTMKWFLIAFAAVLLISAAAVQPQLSLDEQAAIVDAVVQTMNPEAMRATVAAEVEADLIKKFTDAGYLGIAAALSVAPQETEVPAAAPVIEPTATPAELLIDSAGPEATEEPAAVSPEEVPADAEGSPDQSAERQIDSGIDYWNGAVQQADGTYRGLHAKQVSAYAYTIGEDENGVVRQFHTEYTPNTRFNLDVVFENDGSVIWPARMKMCHVGNVGEYTGHAECVEVDHTYDPIKPGERCGFTVSAYGSENLGWTTFYFQLYDADSGSVIEGGQGSFTYHAI